MSAAYKRWKKSAKMRKPSERNPSIISDVRLADFANSVIAGGKGRMKKFDCNLTQEVKQIGVPNEENDTLDDFDVTKIKAKDMDANKTSTSVSSEVETSSSEYCNVYPLDIWFHLAKFIAPEDIKTFSLICKSSYSVVNTPKFWINLYKRHYCKMNMPKHLLPHCLEIHHGLKASVIQAMFYMYKPFSDVASTSMYVNKFEVLQNLIGKCCILMSIQKESCPVYISYDIWIYKFKFKKTEYGIHRREMSLKNKLHIESDINANPEEDCQILLVRTKEFVALPCIYGSKLKKVCCVFKGIQFTFSSNPFSYSTSDDVEFILRPCFELSLINWWHPMYHSESYHRVK